MRQPRNETRPPPVQSIDGNLYTPATDSEIESAVAACFGSPPGLRTLAYLESLTTRRVLGPTATDQELRHLEGARWLVGIIRARIGGHKNAMEQQNVRLNDGGGRD